MIQRDKVVPNINMDGGTTGTPAVCNLPTQEASRDGYTSTTYTEAGGMTGTPAVRNLHAQETSCDGDAVVQQDNVVPDINMDVGRPGYLEAQCYGYALHCCYYKRLHAVYKLLTLWMQCTHC